MNRKLIAAALVAGLSFTSVAEIIRGLEVYNTVTPGVWCSDFDAAKAYSDEYGVPMLVFWANPGCHYCELLEKACTNEDFKKWQKESGYVMVFSYGNSAVKRWIMKLNKISEYPMMAFYWNGSGKAFVGRNGKMAVKGGTLQSQLMDTMDKLSASWSKSDSVIPQPEPAKEPEIGDFGAFHPNRNYKAIYPFVGTVIDEDGIFGIIQLKIGKEKKGKSKVSAVVIGLDGKKYSSTAISVECGENSSFTASVRNLGTLNIHIGNDGFAGTLGAYTVATASVGGTIAKGVYAFSVESPEDAFPFDDYDIIGETIPDGYEITYSGKKFDCGRIPTIKYKKIRDDGEVSYDLIGIDDDNKPNCSGLKLSYTTKTGIIKGSFKVCLTNEESVDEGRAPKIKKYSASISGFIINGEGICQATINKRSYSCSISRID